MPTLTIDYRDAAEHRALAQAIAQVTHLRQIALGSHASTRFVSCKSVLLCYATVSLSAQTRILFTETTHVASDIDVAAGLGRRLE